MPVRRFIVTGRVQGVGYRFFAFAAARRRGLTGFTRNLSDGSVEVIARGNSESLAGLSADLAQGPPASSVDGVRQTDWDTEERWDAFEIRGI